MKNKKLIIRSVVGLVIVFIVIKIGLIFKELDTALDQEFKVKVELIKSKFDIDSALSCKQVIFNDYNYYKVIVDSSTSVLFVEVGRIASSKGVSELRRPILDYLLKTDFINLKVRTTYDAKANNFCGVRINDTNYNLELLDTITFKEKGLIKFGIHDGKTVNRRVELLKDILFERMKEEITSIKLVKDSTSHSNFLRINLNRIQL